MNHACSNIKRVFAFKFFSNKVSIESEIIFYISFFPLNPNGRPDPLNMKGLKLKRYKDYCKQINKLLFSKHHIEVCVGVKGGILFKSEVARAEANIKLLLNSFSN